MTNSLIIRSPGTTTITNRPKFTRDPMIRPGTKFLFDFSRDWCHPNREIVAGALDSKNAVDLTDDNVGIVYPAAGWDADAAGAVTNDQSSGNTEIGDAGEFNRYGSDNEYIVTLWLKLTTGYNTTSNYPFSLSHTTAVQGQFCFALGNGGLTPSFYRCGQSAGYTAPALSLDEPHMLAAHVVPGVEMSFYVDGELQWTNGATNATVDAPTQKVRLEGIGNRTTYRASLCDLTVSQTAEAALGFNSDAILTAEQHIQREWAFCTNALTTAPKTAFV